MLGYKDKMFFLSYNPLSFFSPGTGTVYCEIAEKAPDNQNVMYILFLSYVVVSRIL